MYSMKTHHCVSIVPLFNHLSGEDQEQIDRLVSHRHFHKGETIWQPGNDPLLIIVARGTLKVYMISSSGREQLLRILNPGDYEGVNTLLGAMAQDIFIDSITDTEVCLLRKKDFTALLSRTPQLALKLLELYAQRMADTENQTRFLTMENVETRLATYLQALSLQVSPSSHLTLPMKMKDLASYLGITPETLSRKLHNLENKGIISRKGRKLRILSPSALTELAEN